MPGGSQSPILSRVYLDTCNTGSFLLGASELKIVPVDLAFVLCERGERGIIRKPDSGQAQ